ncbi:MAG TPA: hypothetical protein VGL38_06215 [bacterium]|jgi:hypothetical protein
MFQRLVAVVLLVSFAFFEIGCYTLKPYKPQDVKPEWEIAYAIKTDSSVVRFDDEDPATIQGRMVVGSIRNDFSELRPRRVPLDSVCLLRVRQTDTSTRALVIAGVGVGIATFFVISILSQHRSKGNDTGGAMMGASAR